MNINKIQQAIAAEGADAYLMLDYENKNPNMVNLLGKLMLTRKIFMIIPKKGRPYLIAHTIDNVYLNTPSVTDSFDIKIYKTWQQMLDLEAMCLKQYKTVLMDISTNGLLPRVSLADYGSVDYVKSLGLQVKSSMNVLQSLSCVMDEEQRKQQDIASELLLQAMDLAFRKIKEMINLSGETSEYEIQQYIVSFFEQHNLYFDEAPLVAIGKNASNPHYTPTKDQYSPIKKGDLVLIDMWAKLKEPGAVYGDITWMGYVGEKVPDIYAKRFELVKGARDAAIAFIEENLGKRETHGYEVDQAARNVIEKGGYGDYFTHRLGHSIYDDDGPHGPGANMDNYESKEERILLEATSFSDEPGIYAPDFGMRSETDLRIENGKLKVVAGLQKEIVPILK